MKRVAIFITTILMFLSFAMFVSAASVNINVSNATSSGTISVLDLSVSKKALKISNDTVTVEVGVTPAKGKSTNPKNSKNSKNPATGESNMVLPAVVFLVSSLAMLVLTKKKAGKVLLVLMLVMVMLPARTLISAQGNNIFSAPDGDNNGNGNGNGAGQCNGKGNPLCTGNGNGDDRGTNTGITDPGTTDPGTTDPGAGDIGGLPDGGDPGSDTGGSGGKDDGGVEPGEGDDAGGLGEGGSDEGDVTDPGTVIPPDDDDTGDAMDDDVFLPFVTTDMYIIVSEKFTPELLATFDVVKIDNFGVGYLVTIENTEKVVIGFRWYIKECDEPATLEYTLKLKSNPDPAYFEKDFAISTSDAIYSNYWLVDNGPDYKCVLDPLTIRLDYGD